MKNNGTTFRRSLALVLSVLMIFTIVPLTALTSAATVEFDGGDGTAATPYLISTAAQLAAICENRTAYYKLASDITLTDTYTGAVVSPAKDKTAFAGEFDGNGHTISGLKIVNDGAAYVGLFGVNGGTIKNLKLADVSVTVTAAKKATTYVGALVGFNAGAIDSVSVTGTVTVTAEFGRAYAGGLVGYHNAASAKKISNCYADVDVSCAGATKNFAGGIVGYGYKGSMEKCYAIGSAAADYAGVIVGYAASEFVMDKVYYTDSAVAGTGYLKGTSARSAYKMTRQASYKGFDFANTWVMVTDGYEYPVLRIFVPAFAKGQGTEEAPYEIGNVEELERVGLYMDANFVLTADIALTEDWAPLGDLTDGFTGVLDGQGHKITGLNIEAEATANAGIGLFAMNKGTIKNLVIDGATVSALVNTATAKIYVGAVAGRNNGVIENVLITGSSSVTGVTNAGKAYTGGITGLNYGTIVSVEIDEDVAVGATASGAKAYAYAAGIAAYNGSVIDRVVSYADAAAYKVEAGFPYDGAIAAVDNGTTANAYKSGDDFTEVDLGYIWTMDGEKLVPTFAVSLDFTAPTATTVKQNAALDITGASANIVCMDGSEIAVELTAASFTGVDTATLGVQTATLTVAGFTASFSVEVVSPIDTVYDIANSGARKALFGYSTATFSADALGGGAEFNMVDIDAATYALLNGDVEEFELYESYENNNVREYYIYRNYNTVLAGNDTDGILFFTQKTVKKADTSTVYYGLGIYSYSAQSRDIAFQLVRGTTQYNVTITGIVLAATANDAYPMVLHPGQTIYEVVPGSTTISGEAKLALFGHGVGFGSTQFGANGGQYNLVEIDEATFNALTKSDATEKLYTNYGDTAEYLLHHYFGTILDEAEGDVISAGARGTFKFFTQKVEKISGGTLEYRLGVYTTEAVAANTTASFTIKRGVDSIIVNITGIGDLVATTAGNYPTSNFGGQTINEVVYTTTTVSGEAKLALFGHGVGFSSTQFGANGGQYNLVEIDEATFNALTKSDATEKLYTNYGDTAEYLLHHYFGTILDEAEGDVISAGARGTFKFFTQKVEKISGGTLEYRLGVYTTEAVAANSTASFTIKRGFDTVIVNITGIGDLVATTAGNYPTSNFGGQTINEVVYTTTTVSGEAKLALFGHGVGFGSTQFGANGGQYNLVEIDEATFNALTKSDATEKLYYNYGDTAEYILHHYFGTILDEAQGDVITAGARGTFKFFTQKVEKIDGGTLEYRLGVYTTEAVAANTTASFTIKRGFDTVIVNITGIGDLVATTAGSYPTSNFGGQSISEVIVENISVEGSAKLALFGFNTGFGDGSNFGGGGQYRLVEIDEATFNALKLANAVGYTYTDTTDAHDHTIVHYFGTKLDAQTGDAVTGSRAGSQFFLETSTVGDTTEYRLGIYFDVAVAANTTVTFTITRGLNTYAVNISSIGPLDATESGVIPTYFFAEQCLIAK